MLGRLIIWFINIKCIFISYKHRLELQIILDCNKIYRLKALAWAIFKILNSPLYMTILSAMTFSYNIYIILTKLILFFVVLCRIERLARDIFQTVKDQPLTAVCILKGGYRFFTDLLDKVTALNRSHGQVSVPITIDFIRLKSYEVMFVTLGIRRKLVPLI